MSRPVRYLITSTYADKEPVGIATNISFTKRQASVPVILGGRIIDFSASQNILPGPVRLGIGKLPYTFEMYGNVVASDDSNQSQEWYIFPHDEKENLFYIGTSLPTESDERPEVWNAEYSGGPIRLEPLSRGRPEQIFHIVPTGPRK